MSKRDEEILRFININRALLSFLIGRSKQYVAKRISEETDYISCAMLWTASNKADDPAIRELFMRAARKYFPDEYADYFDAAPEPYHSVFLRKLSQTQEGRELIEVAKTALASERNIEQWLRTHMPTVVEKLVRQ